MRRRTTGVIGVMVSDFANPLYASTITATEARLQTAGYALFLANTHNDKRREKQMLDLFRRRRIDGLVLGPCQSEDPGLIERIRSNYFPVAAMDRDFGSQDSGLHVDHFHGAMQATRYLLNLGHTRIALLTSTSALRPGRERIEGFKAAFAERGLKTDPALIRAERSSMEFAFSEALALLSLSEPPTAFICLGTRILAGVLQGLRHSGRSVPEDASVISIGDTDLSRLFSPAITALTWDFQAVGEAMAELILKRVSPDETPEPERIVVTTQLILRESCAPLGREFGTGEVVSRQREIN